MAQAMRRESRLAGAVLLIGAQAVVLVFGYVTHLWIGRELGPAPYGVYGVVLSLQTIVGLLLALGVPVAVSRFVARDTAHAQGILGQGLRAQSVLALVIAGATWAASQPLARLLNDLSLAPYIQFTAGVVFLQAYYPLFVQFLSGMHAFKRQAWLTVLYAVTKLAGALLLLYSFAVYGAFAGFAIGGIVAAIVGFFWTRGVGGRAARPLPYHELLSFAGTYVLILVGLQILISLDLFMVKALIGDDVQAGYYNAAVTLSRISYVLLQALAFILLPSVSALTKPGGSHDQAVRFIRDTIRYLIALIVPAVALAATTSKALLILFYSAEYAPAAPALTILMVGLGSLAFYLLLTNIAAGTGRARTGLYCTLGLVALSTGLGFVLIPRYGLTGAAWQTTLTGLVGLAVLSLYIFRTFGIPFPLRSTLNIISASIVAVVPTYIWQPTPLTLPLFYLGAALLYTVTLLLLREITVADRTRLASLHPSLGWLAR